MGSLLGIVHSTYIEVTNCYAVPQEKGEKGEEVSKDSDIIQVKAAKMFIDILIVLLLLNYLAKRFP